MVYIFFQNDFESIAKDSGIYKKNPGDCKLPNGN